MRRCKEPGCNLLCPADEDWCLAHDPDMTPSEKIATARELLVGRALNRCLFDIYMLEPVPDDDETNHRYQAEGDLW
jgi:hypothetical protein